MKAFAAVVAVAALMLTAPARVEPAPAKRTALLVLATAHPVVLRGSRFLAGERVTVVVYASRVKRTGRATAGPRGGFLVRFAGLRHDRCNDIVAIARGSRGSVALLKRPLVFCPPRD